jgi:hypothetical protein
VAANFESYAGGCLAKDLVACLAPFGFRESVRVQFAAHPAAGGRYVMVFERAA